MCSIWCHHCKMCSWKHLVSLEKTHNKGSFLYFSCHSKCLQPDIDTVTGLDRSVAQNKMKVKLKNGCGPTYVCWVWHCPCPLLFNIFAEYSILICYMSPLQLSGCCFHLVSLCVCMCACVCVSFCQNLILEPPTIALVVLVHWHLYISETVCERDMKLYKQIIISWLKAATKVW